MKIGVFVGSFDPVHTGHINVINHLINHHVVDKVMVVATGNYWQKQSLTDLKMRLEMLNYIKSDSVIIDDKHNGLSYTYQVLDALEKEFPEDEFYLIIGADNANTLSKWKHYEALMKRKIIVVNRGHHKIRLTGKNVIIINENFGDVSSTDIRRNPKANMDKLDKMVYKYITENNLYGR